MYVKFLFFPKMGNYFNSIKYFFIDYLGTISELDFKIVNFFYKFSSYLKLINSYSEIAWIIQEVFYGRDCK